jgi:hypothetical protein
MVTNDSHVVLLRDETRARGFRDETRVRIPARYSLITPHAIRLPWRNNAILLNNMNFGGTKYSRWLRLKNRSLIKVKGQTEHTFRMIAASRQMSAEIKEDIRAIRSVVLRHLERFP